MNRLSLLSSANSVDARNKLSALDVHDALYSSTDRVDVNALGRFYEPDAVYENPLLVSTSRMVLTMLHSLVNGLLHIDLPHPLAYFGGYEREPLIRISRTWSEVIEISESETFDHSRKVYLEHIVHVLALPGLHAMERDPWSAGSRGDVSRDSIAYTEGSRSSINLTHTIPPIKLLSTRHSQPQLDLGWFKLPISPLHFQLRVTSRLSFNDAGRISRHRDSWDVKDLFLAFFPITRPFVWIWARVMGYFFVLLAWFLVGPPPGQGIGQPNIRVRVSSMESSPPRTRTTTMRSGTFSLGDSSSGDLVDTDAMAAFDDNYRAAQSSSETRQIPQSFRRRSNSTSVDVPSQS